MKNIKRRRQRNKWFDGREEKRRVERERQGENNSLVMYISIVQRKKKQVSPHLHPHWPRWLLSCAPWQLPHVDFVTQSFSILFPSVVWNRCRHRRCHRFLSRLHRHHPLNVPHWSRTIRSTWKELTLCDFRSTTARGLFAFLPAGTSTST